MKLYMAGALFTAAEKQFNRELAVLLRGFGHKVFLPQESEENKRAEMSDDPAAAIFESDVAGIDWADCVLACIDGPDPDSGTSWEIGYGYAKDKFIVCYRTDFREWNGFDPVNLMLTESSHEYIHLPGDNLAALAVEINHTLVELERDSTT